MLFFLDYASIVKVTCERRVSLKETFATAALQRDQLNTGFNQSRSGILLYGMKIDNIWSFFKMDVCYRIYSI